MGLAAPEDLRRIADATLPRSQGFWAAVKSFFGPPKLEPVAAVCIPPGARLMLRDISTRMQTDLGVGPAEEVTFTQITASVNSYRDAVRFRNGQQARLQELREGQRVKVLDLTLAETFEPVMEERPELLFRFR
jgi:hypothetical protein